MDRMIFDPEKLRQLRMDRRLSRQKLAQRVGVGESTVKAWEEGAREPGDADLVLLTMAMNCRRADFAKRWSEANLSAKQSEGLGAKPALAGGRSAGRQEGWENA